ncbi:MAG: hypothetical protein K9M99_13070 [Candidatus Cloacimonetes bacterium]|nr:hypothetical protein [Candidatus Cloacimonadota bacterium]
MKKLITVICIILISINLAAIFDDYEPSPRARALGGAYYSISDDANAIFYNPAGLNSTENNIIAGYSKIFNNDFQVLNTIALAIKLPHNFGSIGIGLESMDVDFQDVNLLSEKVYAIGHAINILHDIHSSLDFGYRFNMYHLSMDGNGEQPSFGFDLGALVTLHQRTKIGFTVTNLNNPAVGVDNEHDLPQKFAMGISYQPYTDVTTAIEVKKTINGKTELHAGAEVKIYEMFTLRSGIRNEPTSYSMGAQFTAYNIIVDYGFNTHAIDLTHHFSLGYKF